MSENGTITPSQFVDRLRKQAEYLMEGVSTNDPDYYKKSNAANEMREASNCLAALKRELAEAEELKMEQPIPKEIIPLEFNELLSQDGLFVRAMKEQFPATHQKYLDRVMHMEEAIDWLLAVVSVHDDTIEHERGTRFKHTDRRMKYYLWRYRTRHELEVEELDLEKRVPNPPKEWG